MGVCVLKEGLSAGTLTAVQCRKGPTWPAPYERLMVAGATLCRRKRQANTKIEVKPPIVLNPPRFSNFGQDLDCLR